MSASLNYDYLCCFSNDTAFVVEVKVKNLAASAPLNKIYHWLYIESGQVQKLQFKSMREQDGRNYREFVQGALIFDAEIAKLRLHQPAVEVELAVGGSDSIPADLDTLVRSFLQQII